LNIRKKDKYVKSPLKAASLNSVLRVIPAPIFIGINSSGSLKTHRVPGLVENDNLTRNYVVITRPSVELVRTTYSNSLVYLVKSANTLIVIPGLTRNPVFPRWIPVFAGMTASNIM
jgi:hypothetical protein